MAGITLKLLFSTIARSKQSIDTAGSCSILLGFDYSEAKLCKIQQFSSHFYPSHLAFCSRNCALGRLHCALARLHCALGRLHSALARLDCGQKYKKITAQKISKKSTRKISNKSEQTKRHFKKYYFVCRVCIFQQGPFSERKKLKNMLPCQHFPVGAFFFKEKAVFWKKIRLIH